MIIRADEGRSISNQHMRNIQERPLGGEEAKMVEYRAQLGAGFNRARRA